MSASFPPMMFSMEELVGVVKLIIQMESAVAANDDQKVNPQHRAYHKHRGRNNGKRYHKHKHRGARNGKHSPNEPPNIQRWIARRSKRDILFLLASISGVKMKIYSLPITHKQKHSSKSLKHKHKIKHKASVVRERVCRVSMDGKYLSMGEDCINLDQKLEISLGVDMCYANVRIILKQMGLFDYCLSNHSMTDSSSATTPSSDNGHSQHIITDEIIRNARFNHRIRGNDKGLKAKHCLTIHNTSTQRTLILQLMNCGDRTLWAKGLCHLKHSNQKAMNFRWTVVAYLISKYASTLNAHSKNNLSNAKGLKGVKQGLSALKMGLSGHKSKKMSAKPMMSAPCYVQPFVSLITMIGAQNSHGLQPRYPKRYSEMYKRRQNRLKHNRSNYERFGENDLMFDPNKVRPKPEDNDLFYE